MKEKIKEKIIFVIPAYNEEKNIGIVIDEIRKDVKGADIVVVNDCSKDNTSSIVKEKGVPCITVPFNLRYSWALQTGIKYAYKNDYDKVIYFDGDGQHIAKEAIKLIEKQLKTKADLVIGSRFLKATDYKHPFFRKIGTKIFSIMIRVFCRKRISDPTSGFQIINKKLIKKFSEIGSMPEYPDANLIIELLLNDYKIEEVSVKMRLNNTGQSMHNGIIKPIKYMIKIFYSIIIIFIKYIGRKKENYE